MERWEAKLLALFGCFLLPLLCTLLPRKLSSIVASWTSTPSPSSPTPSRGSRRYKQVLGWLMCFGGGIFFGTYLLHMGPEVRKLLKDSLLDPYRIDYPVADLFVGLGFLLVLFAEKFVLRWHKRRIKRKSVKRRARQALGDNGDDNGDDSGDDNGDVHSNHKSSGNHVELDSKASRIHGPHISTDKQNVTTSFYDNPAIDSSSAGSAEDRVGNGTHGSLESEPKSKAVTIPPVMTESDSGHQKSLSMNEELHQHGSSINEEEKKSSDRTVSSATVSNDSVRGVALEDEDTDCNGNKKKQQHRMTSHDVSDRDNDVIVNYMNALCGEVSPGVGVVGGARDRGRVVEIQGGVSEKLETKHPIPIDVELASSELASDHNYTKKKSEVALHANAHHNRNDDDDDDYDDVDHHHHEGHHHHSTRSLILILALSLHRVFEGMSVGLQQSLYSIWSLFLAVMCHETVIGFSLGLQFVKAELSTRRLLVTSLLCSSIMPVGVAIGMVMTETGSESVAIEIANGVLQAVAMGTFIYVTFFEILQEELDPEDTSLGKVVCVALGFFLMALLDLIPEEQSLHSQATPTSPPTYIVTTAWPWL